MLSWERMASPLSAPQSALREYSDCCRGADRYGMGDDDLVRPVDRHVRTDSRRCAGGARTCGQMVMRYRSNDPTCAATNTAGDAILRRFASRFVHRSGRPTSEPPCAARLHLGAKMSRPTERRMLSYHSLQTDRVIRILCKQRSTRWRPIASPGAGTPLPGRQVLPPYRPFARLAFPCPQNKAIDVNPRAIAAAVQAVALFLCASTARSQTVVESDSAALVLRMEASQPSYRAGDTIRIRFTLRNTTAETVAVRSYLQFFAPDASRLRRCRPRVAATPWAGHVQVLQWTTNLVPGPPAGVLLPGFRWEGVAATQRLGVRSPDGRTVRDPRACRRGSAQAAAASGDGLPTRHAAVGHRRAAHPARHAGRPDHPSGAAELTAFEGCTTKARRAGGIPRSCW